MHSESQSSQKFTRALEAYRIAQTDAVRIRNTIGLLLDNLNTDLIATLERVFGLSVHKIPQIVPARIIRPANLSEWPSQEVLLQTFQNLARTYENVQIAWQELSLSERAKLNPPPSRMSIQWPTS